MIHAPPVAPETPLEVSPLTHRSLTEACVRPPGTPPSQCKGALAFLYSQIDGAQAVDGYEVGDLVAVDSYSCGDCGHRLIVSHAERGWLLRNETFLL